jgi:hypothetical protein
MEDFKLIMEVQTGCQVLIVGLLLCVVKLLADIKNK